MCYEIAGVGWKGNYNFYNNLMPDYLIGASPLSISYIDVVTNKVELRKGCELAFHQILKK
jgi:hypothetical protein